MDNNESLKIRIEAALSLSVCSGWDRGFLESIVDQVSRGRALSKKQEGFLEQVLNRNTPEHQEIHEKWEETYREAFANQARVVATYYSRTSYYREISDGILRGEVPERKSFLRMIENDYAQKVWAQYEAAPKYEKGSLVTARARFTMYAADFDDKENRVGYPQRRTAVEAFRQRGALIISVDSRVFSAAKGAKRYKVLPIGCMHPFFVEERHVKTKRK
jgi:hypothetical protein